MHICLWFIAATGALPTFSSLASTLSVRSQLLGCFSFFSVFGSSSPLLSHLTVSLPPSPTQLLSRSFQDFPSSSPFSSTLKLNPPSSCEFNPISKEFQLLDRRKLHLIQEDTWCNLGRLRSTLHSPEKHSETEISWQLCQPSSFQRNFLLSQWVCRSCLRCCSLLHLCFWSLIWLHGS